MSISILRLPEVQARTGLSRSSIYLKMSKNEFPERVSLGVRAVGWSSEDIDNWIVEQLGQSDSPAKRSA